MFSLYMSKERRVSSVITLIFTITIFGSCASRKAFHKRQFLPGRNINLSHKLRVSKVQNLPSDIYAINEPKDSLLVADKSSTTIAPSDEIQTKFKIAPEFKSKKNILIEQSFQTTFTENTFAPKRRNLNRLSKDFEHKVHHFRRETDQEDKRRSLILTSLLYILGLAALATAIISIIAGMPEIVIGVIGGIGFILLYFGWSYWQQHGKAKKVESKESETPLEKKPSKNTVSNETFYSILIGIFGIGLIAYYLFYF